MHDFESAFDPPSPYDFLNRSDEQGNGIKSLGTHAIADLLKRNVSLEK